MKTLQRADAFWRTDKHEGGNNVSDVEKILEDNHQRKTAHITVEKRRKDREDRECRRLNRQIARMAYWFSGTTTVLGCVGLATEAWWTGGLMAAATVLLLICGRILED